MFYNSANRPNLPDEVYLRSSGPIFNFFVGLYHWLEAIGVLACFIIPIAFGLWFYFEFCS